ncbi:hypothetical protein KY330_00685 [Candidatus Woesearchaeota archaeon]|nr:hypothetical protein [Candidatus Woesearchaeota archaeon]
MNSWIIRYGEIALKGKNRKEFENKLVKNIKDFLKKNNIKDFQVVKTLGRIIIQSDKDCSIIKDVFGIVSISPAIRCDANLETIKQIIKENFFKEIKETFRVTTKRTDKSMKFKSMEVDKEIGGYIVEQTNKKVNLKNFKTEIGIELNKNKAYVFSKKIKGYGGLPIGIEGDVYCQINKENKRASLLAAWLIMKRGCEIYPIGFKQTSISLLNKFRSNNLKLKTIKNLSELNTKKALVVDDTLESIKDYNFKGLILRPLISYSEEEIRSSIDSLSD